MILRDCFRGIVASALAYIRDLAFPTWRSRRRIANSDLFEDGSLEETE